MTTSKGKRQDGRGTKAFCDSDLSRHLKDSTPQTKRAIVEAKLSSVSLVFCSSTISSAIQLMEKHVGLKSTVAVGRARFLTNSGSIKGINEKQD